MKDGRLILIYGLTGSGKGTLIEHLKTVFTDLVYVHSLTTRERRDGVENKSYVFVSNDEFEKKIEQGALAEWTQNEGKYYGTEKKEILEGLREGKVLVKEMEARGLKEIQNLLPRTSYVLVYVDPEGGWEEAVMRIKQRAHISDEEIEERRTRYQTEIESFPTPDYVIHNPHGKLDDAKKEAEQVIHTILSS